MSMMRPRFKGEPRAVCDRCGVVMHVSDLTADGQYPGLRVCSRCWDPKHPQMFVRAVPDPMTVPNARPERKYGYDEFIEDPVDPNTLYRPRG